MKGIGHYKQSTRIPNMETYKPFLLQLTSVVTNSIFSSFCNCRFTEITSMGTWSKFAKPIECIESESRYLF